MGNRVGYPTRYFFTQPTSSTLSKEEIVTDAKEPCDKISETHESEKVAVVENPVGMEENQSLNTDKTDDKEEPLATDVHPTEEKKEEAVTPPPLPPSAHKKKRHRHHKK